MMELTIGAVVIPYEVRESARTRVMKIVVTPGLVEVVVPVGTPMHGPNSVTAYVERKRRWVFNAVREIREKHQALLRQQYASGAKLQYRGRWLMLDVQAGEVSGVGITCRSKFHVMVPAGLEGGARTEAVRVAFDAWLKERTLETAERLGRQHERTLGVQATGYRLSDSKERWGACGKDGVIRVHWRLAQAPAPALEYVVAHEVTHLVHRNHSPEFWRALGRTLPDWAERKGMLERWEGERRAV
ncbi:MAG TPA: SprT family zinc-dependent metalloprotease [Myxococcota bacterium]|nr:SprT family zinc-dependent metalloprotease [Myxococcota bacterium]